MSRAVTAAIVLALVASASLLVPVAATGTASGAGPTKITSCKTTISQPGRYVLAGNITERPSFNRSEARACIRITASDVVLDGGGHTINGGHAYDGIRVGSEAGRVSNVTIRNVKLGGFSSVSRGWAAVKLDDVDGATVENVDVRVSDLGFRVRNSSDVAIRDVSQVGDTETSNTGRDQAVRFENTTDSLVVDGEFTGAGVLLERGSDGNAVRNSSFVGCPDGVACSAGPKVGVLLAGSSNNTVVDNAIRNSAPAVDMSGAAVGNVIADNTLAESEDGVHVSVYDAENGTNVIRDNDMAGDGDGVDVKVTTAPLDVRANIIRGPTESGYWNGSGRGVHVGDTPLCADGGEGAQLISVHGNVVTNESAGGVVNEDADVLNATNNYWGAESGPSSANDTDAPFEDPVTGTLADGNGTTVSEAPHRAGTSNVHFDGWLTAAPADAGTNGTA